MDAEKSRKIGLIPFKAFFVGWGLVIIAMIINLIFPYQGGWPSLSRAVVIIFILLGAGLYSICFFIASLCLCWAYRKQTQANIAFAQTAAILYGCTIIGLVLLWYSI